MPVLHVTLPGGGSLVLPCVPLAPRSRGPLFWAPWSEKSLNVMGRPPPPVRASGLCYQAGEPPRCGTCRQPAVRTAFEERDPQIVIDEVRIPSYAIFMKKFVLFHEASSPPPPDLPPPQPLEPVSQRVEVLAYS